jgi:multicomponent Na+:H+ antiporter subunit D
VEALLPLSVAIPLTLAAGVTAAGVVLRTRRRILDGVCLLTACAVAGMLIAIFVWVGTGEKVYWFAGIHPSRGTALGIDFSVDRVNCGLACLAAVLVIASLLFSWRYFDEVSTRYHSLMLVFLAGMVGFCLTGDVFDLFVWFELMGVAAYALTAYRPEEKGPLQGALNFAITNSVGAYLTLSGIAIVYARTGALNMAQIGSSLERGRPAGVVTVAFLLIIMGFLTKGAVAPFHLWLADAHAVAPTPVCVLLSGVMVELGLYAVARIYWTMFAGALGHPEALRAIFLILGVVTAAIGALYCFRQRHLKRLLAFSTISHAGLFLVGFALLSPLGLSGAAVYVIGHGLVKAALFLCVGIVLHRLGSVDETALHGRGRQLRVTGAVFVIASLGLIDTPPFATYLGAGWIGDSATSQSHPWITAVVVGSSIVVGGAVLRVAGGVFYGLGDPPPEDSRMRRESSEETSETSSGKQRTPQTMIVPAIVLVAAAVAIGLLPHLGNAVENAAMRFQDQPAYTAAVLPGGRVGVATNATREAAGVTAATIGASLATLAGSVLLAAAALYRRRLPRPRWVEGLTARANPLLDGLQSGIVNDYITWQVFGFALLGGCFAVALH